MPRWILDLTIDPMTLKIGILFSTNTVGNLLIIGTIPTRGWVEDVFVRVKVVGGAFVVALNNVDKDEFGVFLGLRWERVVLGIDVGCVAVV